MASSVKLYTIGNMINADIDSATSSATGYPKENLIDNNPDTWWKGTSTSDQWLDIDLNSVSLQVDCFFVFVHNYASLVDSKNMTLWWSDDDSAYTGVAGAVVINNLTGPIPIVKTSNLSLTHRYWRIKCVSITTIPEVSMIGFGTTHSITQGNEYPEDDTDVFYNQILKGKDGRNMVTGVNSRSFKTFSRKFTFNGTTNWLALQAAHQDSRGSLLPLVLLEGTAGTDDKLVTFVDDNLKKNETDYHLYKPVVKFAEMPYVPDGESY